MTTTREKEHRGRSRCDSNTSSSCTAASLLQLNDDVLELILAQLPVYQQFELRQLHSRLRSIIQALWRMRVRHVMLQDELIARASSRQFQAFMLALAPHLERLSCQQLDVRRLRMLSGHRLPGVSNLEWLGGGDDCGQRFVDEDVRLVKRVFPALRQLKLRGCQVTGKYLCELELLNELCLDDCQFLESQYFRDIFRTLKLRKFDIMEDCDEVNCCDLVDVQLCPTLEHIKIADYHLCMESDITQQLLRLPRLHKLSIYSKNFVFDVLERIARPSHAAHAPGNNNNKQIVGFRFSGLLHDYGRFFRELSNLRHLHKLEIHGQSEEQQQQLQCLSDQMLCQLAAQLPELCELHLCGYQLESPAGLLQFLLSCRQLRILDMTRSRCIGDALPGRCLALLSKQNWRTQPLELWIKQSDINPNIVQHSRFLFCDKWLRIDTKKMTPHLLYMSGVLKFSFVR